MRNERTQVNDIVFVNSDLIEIGDARNINENINPFADAAFKFEDEVGAAGYNAGAVFVLP